MAAAARQRSKLPTAQYTCTTGTAAAARCACSSNATNKCRDSRKAAGALQLFIIVKWTGFVDGEQTASSSSKERSMRRTIN